MAPSAIREGSKEPREVEMRARNERIAAAARRHHFDHVAPVPFLCECSDPECEALVRITLAEYDATRRAADFLTAPGHQVEQAEIVRLREAVWLYRSLG